MTAPEPLTVEEVRVLKAVAEGAEGVMTYRIHSHAGPAGVGSTAPVETWFQMEHVDPHLMAHILAATPGVVLRLLAVAEEHAALVARVGALAEEAIAREAASLSRTFDGGSFGAWVDAHAIRAALGGIDDGGAT